MNQEIPLSGGDAIINAVSGQWGTSTIVIPPIPPPIITPTKNKLINSRVTL